MNNESESLKMHKEQEVNLKQLFHGSSEMAQVMQQYDWEKSALGPVATWPETLKATVRMMLANDYPISIWWGEELTMLYNDAYKKVICQKHLYAIGQPLKEVWAEIWAQIAPMLAKIIREGKSWFEEGMLFYVDRGYGMEEVYYTFSDSPILEEDGTVGGVLCTCHEVTEQVLYERRLHTITQIAGIRNNINLQESCDSVLNALADNPNDFPFAILYTVTDGQIKLKSYTKDRFTEELEAEQSIKNGSLFLPEHVVRSQAIITIPDEVKSKLKVPKYGMLPKQAIILPVYEAGQDLIRGYFILGVSPVLPLNEAYQKFLQLLSAQIDAVITAIRALEQERLHSKRLVEIDNLKNAFFSNVSYALRAPVTSIIDVLEGIEDAETNTNITKAISHVKQNGYELLKQVNSLLSFSAVEFGRYAEGFMPKDLTLLADELSRNVRQENLLETILDAISDSFVYFTLDLNFVFVNKRVYKIRGRTREDYIGKHVLDLYPYINGSELHHRLEEASKTLQAQYVEFFDATIETWYEVRVYPSAQGIAMYLADVTERKKQEQEKRELEERFKVLANAAPVLLWMSGPDQLCNFVNDSWLSFRGRRLEEELGDGWTAGVHPADLDYCLKTYKNSFANRTKYTMEYRMLSGEGEYRWLLEHAVPHFTGTGELEGYIAACVDITNHKWAENVLAEYNKELEENVLLRTNELIVVNEQLQQLTGYLQEVREEERKLIAREIHDELGQALAAFKIELSLFQDRVSNSRSKVKTAWLEDLAGMEQALTKAINSMRKIVSRLRPSLADDIELIHELKKLVADLTNRVKIDIRFTSELDELLLEPHIAIEVYRVIQECLTNVIKHSQATDAQIIVTQAINQYKFIVTDNGIGFSKTTSAGQATFGLLGIQERAQRIGATLNIESNPYSGTRIELIVKKTEEINIAP